MEKDKKTKKELFTELLAIEGITDEQKAFINHEVELLEKKHNSTKPTKAQEENELVKSAVVAVLKSFDGKAVTITELQKTPELEGYSNQKISALIRLLVIGGTVVRTEEKRVAYFKIA